jgi:hypothetical protein
MPAGRHHNDPTSGSDSDQRPSRQPTYAKSKPDPIPVAPAVAPKPLATKKKKKTKEDEWWELFAHLLAYKEEFGDFNVAASHTLEDEDGNLVRLGDWLAKQKKGMSKLPEERYDAFAQLAESGLWDNKTTGAAQSSSSHLAGGGQSSRVVGRDAAAEKRREADSSEEEEDNRGGGRGAKRSHTGRAAATADKAQPGMPVLARKKSRVEDEDVEPSLLDFSLIQADGGYIVFPYTDGVSDDVALGIGRVRASTDGGKTWILKSIMTPQDPTRILDSIYEVEDMGAEIAREAIAVAGVQFERGECLL